MKNICLTLTYILLFALSIFAQTHKAQKIDEFGDLECEAAWARLDSFAISAQSEPNAKVHIIFYGGKRYRNGYIYSKKAKIDIQVFSLPRRGEARATVARWREYLVDNRGIDSSRIFMVDGGYRENHSVELWLVPIGAKQPELTPTLEENDMKFRKGKAQDKNCGWLG